MAENQRETERLQADIERQKKIRELRGKAFQYDPTAEQRAMPSIGSLLWSDIFGVPAERELKIEKGRQRAEAIRQERAEAERQIAELQARTEGVPSPSTELPPVDAQYGESLVRNILSPEGSPVGELPEYLKKEPERPEPSRPMGMQEFIDAYSKNFLEGLPEYNVGYGTEAARLAGKIERTRAAKESTAAELSKGELERMGGVLENKLNLQNQIFNQYAQNNERFQRYIDDVQAKYPVLTRANIMENMSVGEKITTALLTVLGAAGGATPDQNPAWRAFNNALDQSVAQQEMTYQREMATLQAKKNIDDNSFKMAMMQVDNDINMRQRMSENQLKLIDLSRATRSEEELQDIENATKNSLMMQNEAYRYNAAATKFQYQLLAKKYAAELANARGKNLVMFRMPVLSKDGSLGYDQRAMFFKEDFVKNVPVMNELVDKADRLESIATALKTNASTSVINAAIADYNKKFSANLPEQGFLKSFITGGTKETPTRAMPYIGDELMRTIKALNDIADQSTYAPLMGLYGGQ